MKPTNLKLALLLFLGNLFIISCKKHDDLVKPGPQKPPPVLSHSFQMTIDSIPGLPVAPVNNLFAIISLVNEKNDTVLKNKKLIISFDGKFRTPELELPTGNYKVTRFLLTDEKNKVRFATPIANSAKAGLVNKPLPFSFILPQPAVLKVAIEVAKVEPTDNPESFGYPKGTFNEAPGEPNDPGNDNSFFKIKIRLAIRVGEINYDSIPGTVLYTTWDETQQTTGKYVPLTAGTNEISLSRSVYRHHFRITKWGKEYELNLLKNEIKDGGFYTLGGAQQAKLLKTELTYKLVNGNYVADSKTSFSYKADGKLTSIDYYLKKADNTPYLAMRDLFQYDNGRAVKIDRFDEKNQPSAYTSFSYNNEGKVNGITESANDIRTTVKAEYHYSNTTGVTEVVLGYSYSHSASTMNYYQRYRNGNLVSDNSKTNNNSTETGQYDYDNNINPYAHMGWPNLFLSNYSKNNRTNQQKTYFGSYPAAVAYQFIYKYDADGYPIELIRHYKSYHTNQFLFTTKTVYTY